MTTLVTGAGGFIGGAVARAIARQQEPVIALVRDRDPSASFYTDGTVDLCIEARGTLADSERIIADYQPDRIVHLAAQSQVPQANRDPLHTFESNIRGTWLLLEACRNAAKPPVSIVVASSDKAYGDTDPPYREDSALHPTNPYDVSKAAADWIAQSYAATFGLNIVTSRCGNIYGPGDLHPDRLVPSVCRAIHSQQPIVLRSTGKMVREWLYLDDAVHALLLLLDRAPELRGRAYNVGSGEKASVREIVDGLKRIASSDVPVETAKQEVAGEISSQFMRCEALHALGWKPSISLETGLHRTFEWYAQVGG